MESIILSLLSSYLKDYVNNFKKENISVNFLRGNGVIKDLDINVDAINEAVFQSGAPGLRFTRIMINTLSIEAPIMSLKTKPIIIHIDELFVEVGEIVDIVSKPKTTKQQTKSPKYGFIDRVLDSISFEINRIYFALRTLGRLKCAEVGPWTPPVLLLEMTGNRYVTTNQSGVEAELEECFRVRLTKRPMLFVYKKFVCKKVSAYLVNPEVWFQVADVLTNDSDHKNIFLRLNKKFPSGTRGYVTTSIVRNLSLGVNIAMRKRLDNNVMLGFEIAIVFDNAHVCLNQKSFSESIHLMIGVSNALSRRDVILELYGPNPHEEKQKPNLSVMKGRPASTRSIRSDLEVGKEDMLNLEKLDAEINNATQHIATTVTDDDWQRSSLGSDDDPPHYRLVISWEITSAIFTFSYDGFKDSIVTKTSNTRANTQSTLRGVNINILGFVYSTIWPEHALGTEGVQQITFKSLSITEFIGVRKTCLFRTTIPLDDRGSQIPIALLPRGVKELSQYDSENQPGVSFVYRRETDFPPPPISKRIASRLDVMVGNIELIGNLDAWYWYLSFIVESWDERWISGNWNTSEGRLEEMLGSGSGETTVIFNGIQILVYPDFIRKDDDRNASETVDEKDPTYSNTILPSQIIIDIGLLSLIWKHTLGLQILNEYKAISKARESGSKYATYMSDSDDITSILSQIKAIDGIDLLSDRFEASFSHISVKVVTDTSHDLSQGNISNAPTRTVVHPFGFVFATSIDPNPTKTPICPPKESFLSAYTRRYYWALNGSTIHSSTLSCDDIKIECSAVDITRLSHIIQLLNNWVNNVSINQSQSVDAADSSIDGEIIAAGYPWTIKILRISKLHLLLLKDDDTTRKVRNGTIISEADIIVGIQIHSMDLIAEWKEGPASWSSDHLLLKGQLGGVAVLASNRPVFIIVNDEIDPVIQLAGSSAGKWQLKSKKIEPVFFCRYRANSNNIDAIINSLTEESDIATDGLNIVQASQHLVENLSKISDVNFCVYPHTKIVISLQNIDEALQSFLSELLSGAG